MRSGSTPLFSQLLKSHKGLVRQTIPLLKQTFRNIICVLSYKEKRKFTVLIILNTIISVVDIASLALLVYIIHFYTNSRDSFKLTFIPASFLQHDSMLLLGLVLLLFTVKNLAAYAVSVLQYRFVYGVASRIAHLNLLKYLNGEYLDYVNTDAAVHVQKISQEPVEFAHHLLLSCQQIITEAILITFSVTAILWYNAKLFLLLFALLLPPTLLASWLSRRQLKSVRKNIQQGGEIALQSLQEAIAGYIESCIYQRKDYFSTRYSAHQSRLNSYVSSLLIVQSLPSRILEVFAVLGLFLLLYINKLTGNSAVIDITTIGAFMAAAYKIIPGVVKIFNLTGHIKTYEFTLHALQKKWHSSILSGQDQHQHISSISFRGVSFYYHKEAFLENFNLSVKSGEIIGISGKSGKGKTTVVNLLLGFLTQDAGQIFINEKVVSAEDRQSYWRAVSYVKQQTFLLHDTVLNNIILDDQQYNRERLCFATEASGLNSFINEQEDGLNKIITEKGKNISGGQQQRIAIARAIYKDADLLIMDEPFSALDEASILGIMQHLKQLTRAGKSILLISHNQKSLSFCDKIIALNE